MELLNIVRARSIWFFEVRDINPRGRYLDLALMEGLKERYRFTKYPSSATDFDETGGLVFSGGPFEPREGLLISVDFGVYNDGVLADTRSSTKDTDLFLEDVLSWATKDVQIVFHQEMLRRKLYVSEMHVRTERPLNNINPRLHSFMERLSSLAGSGHHSPFELASLGFWVESSSAAISPQFQFERQLNTPFSERRYYTRAPLQTEDHLKLLDEFEDLLVG
jgi:hypothetical protein